MFSRTTGSFGLVFLLSFAPILAGGLAIVETIVTDNGDGDGFADTNETIQVVFVVKNTSGADLTNVNILLTTSTPDIVCITDSMVVLGDIDADETIQAPPFSVHVLDVDRAGLGLDGYDALTAHFDLFGTSNEPGLPRFVTPKLTLDIDLDVSGGSGPGMFFEDFESETLGAFEIQNLDFGTHGLLESDGYRCQDRDPDWAPGTPGGDCYLGASMSHADATFWGISGPEFSPLLGRAYEGFNSMYFGIDLGPPNNWTTPTAVLEAAATIDPVHLDWDGPAPVLSMKHQVSLVDGRCSSATEEDQAVDRGVVMAQFADAADAPNGPWIKIYPHQNGYEQRLGSLVNCTFDPIDDGNTEDDFFDPSNPSRVFGPSSTCFPEYNFARAGETSELFDADNTGLAEGPGLEGFWGIGTWIESRFDLSRFRGRSVRLRFLTTHLKLADGFENWDLFVGNPNACDDGWWIDNVTVTGTLDTAAIPAADTQDNSGLVGPPESDGDTDGIFDVCDNCAADGNADQRDLDKDGLGDVCDPCPYDPAPIANVDLDGDKLCTTDNCPEIFNPDQLDEDGDAFGAVCDCDDDNFRTHPGAVEFNDGVDNQCPGDPGYGLIDEVEGLIGFYTAGNKNLLSWPAMPGTSHYEMARALDATFETGCVSTPLPEGAESFTDFGLLSPGRVRHFVLRAVLPNLGSWGADSAGQERTVACAP